LVHTVHLSRGDYYFVPPGALNLLQTTSKSYEIVVFTSGTQNYADSILNHLDPHGFFIRHRIYRQHTDGMHYKNIDKLGRKLSKTIIVDNNPLNFQLHPNNGLYIKIWKDDIDDHQLFGLRNLLDHIAKIGFKDMREAIRCIKKQLHNRDIDRLSNPYDQIDLQMIK